MKRILILMMSLWLTTGLALAQGELRIAVLSDPHLLSPELAQAGSEALRQADSSDMKMMALSDEIMAAIVDSLLRQQPALVFITGDLTHNGELASHHRIVQHLQRLRQAGIGVLVIPGNHDVSNPYARCYGDGQATMAPTVTRAEFREIYADYGYGEGSRFDDQSLSYRCEPIEGLVVIGIDSNRDEENRLRSRGDSVDTYHNGGRVKPATVQWVTEQIAQARAQGKQVMALMHHHLVPHFDQEHRLLPNYMIENNDSVARRWLDAGLRVIFTGHLHITDAATGLPNAQGDALTEVATGSAVTYPFAWHLASLSHHFLHITTHRLQATAHCPDLQQLGRRRIEAAAPRMADMLARRVWNKVGNRLDALGAFLAADGEKPKLPSSRQEATHLVLRHLRQPIADALLAMTQGNEDEQNPQAIIDATRQGLRAMIDELAPRQANQLWDFFSAQVEPKLEPLVRSVLLDLNHAGTPHERKTNDLTLTIELQ